MNRDKDSPAWLNCWFTVICAVAVMVEAVAGGPQMAWATLIPNECSAGCYAAAVDSQGCILVGSGPRTALTKLDRQGNVVWKWGRPLDNCTGHVWVTAVSLDEFDNIYLAGQATENAVIGAFNTGPVGFGGFFLKMTPARGVVFSRIATNMVEAKHFLNVREGQFLLAGSVRDNGPILYGTLNVAATQYNDLLILKTDSVGNPIWHRRGSGTGLERVNMLATDAAGNIFASMTASLGNTFSIGGLSGTVAADKTLHLARIDPFGNVDWIKSVASQNDPTSAEPVSAPVCHVPQDNSIVWAGDFVGTLPLVSPPLSSAGGKDVFITKWSRTGELIWATAIGGPGNQFASGLAVDSRGNILLVGSFLGQITIGDETLTSRGNEDIFVVKFSTDGIPLWTKQIGYTGTDTSPGVCVTPEGDLVVYGTVQGGLLVDGHYVEGNGSKDGFVIKFLSEGLPPVWVRQPESAVVMAKNSITLRCEASSTSHPLSYQWWLNGSLLDGQTNASLTLTNVQAAQAGTYFSVAANPSGSVRSAVAVLTYAETADLELSQNPSIRIFGTIGRTYAIQRAAEAGGSPPWTTLAQVTLVRSPQVWVDLEAAAVGKRFYRALLLP